MRFEKWQALGNDYLIVEADRLPWGLTPARVRALCAGHTGVGADGVLELSRVPEPDHVAALRIFNPDGSQAELSGNGAREAVLYLRHRGWTDRDRFTIITPAGPVSPQITGPSTCRMQMGTARLTSAAYPSGPSDGRGALEAAGRRWDFQHVSVGNPQCAIAMAGLGELHELDLARLGPPIEGHELFPRRTNVSWYAAQDGAVRARIFERGVGETLSSGTGACGVAVAHVANGGRSPVTVRLDGGDLEVEVGEDLGLALTGWAVCVYRGELSPEMIKELNETE